MTKYQGQHFAESADDPLSWWKPVLWIIAFLAVLVGFAYLQHWLVTSEGNPTAMICDQTVDTLSYNGYTAVCEARWTVPTDISAIEISEVNYQDGNVPKLSADQRLNVKMDGQDTHQTGVNMVDRCTSYSGALVDDVCYKVDK